MNKRTIISIIFSFFIFHFSFGGEAFAVPVTQTFTLKPGWNSVFLKVEPNTRKHPAYIANDELPASDSLNVFYNLNNLISVWAWNPRTGTVEFIQNPTDVASQGPQMMVYLPPEPLTPNVPILTNLFAIHGETGYLIKMKEGTETVTWTVTGEPTVPEIDWKPNSFNFVGFHLDKNKLPLYVNFFSNSPAHAGQEIYRLDNATSKWVKVIASDFMKDGEAFWIYCKGSSEFLGPVSIQLEQGTGLQYGKTLGEQEIKIVNSSAKEKTVTLTVSPNNWLYYRDFNPQTATALWKPIAELPNRKIKSGGSEKLRLGVRRAALTTATPLYEANITVTDGEGMEILLPASVEAINYSGLWVGDAVINKVSEVRIDDALLPTGSLFPFRLIIHVDNAGKVLLLSQVIQMWQEGASGNPGKYVLFSNDALIPKYTGASLRDGQPVGRRISAPAFPDLGNTQFFSNITSTPPTPPAIVDGKLNPSAKNSMMTIVELKSNDKINPFVHIYHPDHLKPDYVRDADGVIFYKDGKKVASGTPGSSPKLNQAKERIFGIKRVITMEFNDVAGLNFLNRGSAEIGGIYSETIKGLDETLEPGRTETMSGLHNNDIKIEGTFLLHKVSDIDVLTTQ